MKKENKQKKKFNKKLLMFAIPLFAIALVAASVLTYYVVFSTTLDVNNVDGMGDYTQDLSGVEYPNSVSGDSIELLNDLESDRTLSIIDDSTESVEVTYRSTLELTRKEVVFGVTPWVVLGDKVQVEYTIVGDEFSAEVTDGLDENYVLVYYADAEDRFANPEEAILVEDVSENLPYITDSNSEFYDYCSIEGYSTCHGAKIWYVPLTAINVDNSLDWSRASEFFFESKLIQYNSDGSIVLYSGDTLEITPEYTPSEHAVGTYEIVTTVA